MHIKSSVSLSFNIYTPSKQTSSSRMHVGTTLFLHHILVPAGGQVNMLFPACWTAETKVIAAQIQCKQRNLVVLQMLFGFHSIQMRSHGTNIIPFLQWLLTYPILPHAQHHRATSCIQPCFPQPKKVVRTFQMSRPSPNLQQQFIHDQYVAIWSCANNILQFAELSSAFTTTHIYKEVLHPF